MMGGNLYLAVFHTAPTPKIYYISANSATDAEKVADYIKSAEHINADYDLYSSPARAVGSPGTYAEITFYRIKGE